MAILKCAHFSEKMQKKKGLKSRGVFETVLHLYRFRQANITRVRWHNPILLSGCL